MHRRLVGKPISCKYIHFVGRLLVQRPFWASQFATLVANWRFLAWLQLNSPIPIVITADVTVRKREVLWWKNWPARRMVPSSQESWLKRITRDATYNAAVFVLQNDTFALLASYRLNWAVSCSRCLDHDFSWCLGINNFSVCVSLDQRVSARLRSDRPVQIAWNLSIRKFRTQCWRLVWSEVSSKSVWSFVLSSFWFSMRWQVARKKVTLKFESIFSHFIW